MKKSQNQGRTQRPSNPSRKQSLASPAPKAGDTEEQLLARLIGKVCTAEAVAAAKAEGQTLGDFVAEATSRMAASRPGCDPKTPTVLVVFTDQAKENPKECAIELPDWLHQMFCDGVPWYAAGESERVIVGDQDLSRAERAALQRLALEPIESVSKLSQMEPVINEVLALLDMFSERYVEMMSRCGGNGGRIGAGAAQLEGMVAGRLDDCFDLAWEEMKSLRQQRAAMRLLIGMPMPKGEVDDLKDYLSLANVMARQGTPARATRPVGGGGVNSLPQPAPVSAL